MLKVNVGLSRKLSRDFNSTGFSVNIEGEICIPMDQPEQVIEKIQEYYDLAEESLRDQVDRYESDSAISSRDEELPKPRRVAYDRSTPPQRSKGNGSNGGRGNDPASTKQINYLLEIGRRQRLTTAQLESEAAQVLGRSVGLYELTKRDAGTVIDALKSGSKA
ncbi:MAG: hypothetical protein Aurels2KO_55370 [Aureliella sp.]